MRAPISHEKQAATKLAIAESVRRKQAASTATYIEERKADNQRSRSSVRIWGAGLTLTREDALVNRSRLRVQGYRSDELVSVEESKR